MKLSKFLDQLSRAAGPETDPKKSRKKLLIKVAVSAALLAFIYSRVDSQRLLSTLRSISLSTCVALVALYTAGQLVSAVKWRIFLSGVGLQRTVSQVVGAYFLGMFVNAFGLGTIGGDVTRALVLRPDKGKRTAALATVIADRMHGLAVLIAIGIIALILVRPVGVTEVVLGAAIAGMVIIVLGWLIGPKVLMKIFPAGHRYGEAAKRISAAFPKNPRAILIASALSTILHLMQITMHILIGSQLGAGLSIGYYFALVPIVNAASSFPISVNGLGVREVMYTMMFVPAGVSREVAVAFGAIWFGTITLVSVLGSVVFAPLATEQGVEGEITDVDADEDKHIISAR